MNANIQLVIPMAGKGSRFEKAGYQKPKPLLEIHGRPMFKVVLANLLDDSICSVTFIVPASWGMGDAFRELSKHTGRIVNVVEIDYVTDGPADSVQLAAPYLDPDLPVVTANSDQYINYSMEEFYKMVQDPSNDGVILCMRDSDPKWSYVRTDPNGLVVEVREKVVISELATIGVYGFRTSRLMLKSFSDMRNSDDRTNGEYYLAPSYNYIISDGGVVRAVELGGLSETVFGLGIPLDFELFVESPVSLKAAELAKEI